MHQKLVSSHATEQLAIFFEDISDPIILFNKAGESIYNNKAFEQVFQIQKTSIAQLINFDYWKSLIDLPITLKEILSLTQQYTSHSITIYIDQLKKSARITFSQSKVGAIGEEVLMVKCSFFSQEPPQMLNYRSMLDMLIVGENLSKSGTWEVDIETNKVTWSKGKYQLLELPLDYEPKLDNVLSFYKEGESRNLISEAVEKAINDALGWEFEAIMVTARGNEIWVKSRGVPVFENGRCRLIRGALQNITEEKNLIDEASNSKKLIEEFSAQLPGVLYLFDLKSDGTFGLPYISNKVVEIYGIEKQKLLNNPNLVIEIIHPEDRVRFMETMNHSMATMEIFKCEYRVKINDRIEWIFAHSTPTKLPDGTIRWIGFAKNITERKLNEFKLRESEEKFRTLIENSPNFIFTHSLDGKIRFISDFTLSYLNEEERESIYEKNIYEYPHPDDKHIVSECIDKLVSEKTKVTSQPFRMWMNGRYEWLIVTGAPMFDVEGSIREILAIGTIVTPLIEKEQALIASEAKAHELAQFYESLVNSEFIYIVCSDLNGRITYVNEHYRKNVCDEADLIGRNIMFNVVADDYDKCIQTAKKSIENPNVVHRVILNKKKSNGDIITISWEFTGRKNEAGIVDEILCVGFDITELINNIKQKERLIELITEQNSRLKNFAYIVSHNIRSHSANLMGISNMLRDVNNENERQQFLEMLHTSTERLEETIQNLNEIVTMQHKARMPKTRLNLKEEVEKATNILKEAIYENLVQIDINVPQNIFVEVIPAYLNSILLNIIDNAFKYRAPDRQCLINIKGYVENEWIVIELVDNGVGFDMKKAKGKIFGMYKTFHQRPDAKGLGLFITKNQIEAMGGRFEIHSVENKGTKVRLYFRR